MSVPQSAINGYAGRDITIRSRVLDADRAVLTVDGISSAYLQVFDSSGQAVYNSEVDVADVVGDLRSGPEWTADSGGYNVELVIPGDAIPDASECYSVYLWCVPAAGGKDFPLVWRLNLTPVQKAEYPT